MSDTTHRCYDCDHYRHMDEGWEMPHIQWHECAKRPGLANLRSFPFHNTKCGKFEKAKSLKEILAMGGTQCTK